MIIDELFKIKSEKIEEHKKRFSEIDENEFILEMFRKKYDETYNINYNPYAIHPFIDQIYLSKPNFWDDKHFDAKDLPRLNNKIYHEIQNFPDYDYLNSIAYEMLIRTAEYQNLRDNISNKYSNDERVVRFDKLGIDINDVFDLKKVADYYSTEKVDKNFTNSYFDMTLNDLNQGLDRLIQFYINKKQIHTIDDVKKIAVSSNTEGQKQEIILRRIFKIIPDVVIEEIKADKSNYFVPAKHDYQMQNLQDKFSMVDENIPLIALEQDFLLSIDDLIPNRIKGSIDFNFTRPLLRFKELPIIDVPLNLNLSIEELTQLVIKLKNDFEEGKVKNPINILYGTKFEFKDLKDITPFKMTKETMAQAFFIYDLYQFINDAIVFHKDKLRQFKESDIKEIENQMYFNIQEKKKEISNRINKIKKKDDKKVDNWLINNYNHTLKSEIKNFQKEKENKISNIHKQYKKYAKDYHPMIILENLARIHDITPYMCKQYLKFMRKYIEKLKYKELIIGTKLENI